MYKKEKKYRGRSISFSNHSLSSTLVEMGLRFSRLPSQIIFPYSPLPPHQLTDLHLLHTIKFDNQNQMNTYQRIQEIHVIVSENCRVFSPYCALLAPRFTLAIIEFGKQNQRNTSDNTREIQSLYSLIVPSRASRYIHFKSWIISKSIYCRGFCQQMLIDIS